MKMLTPHTCIVSGPSSQRNRAIGILGAEGLAAREPEGHGLPSHPDPITAAAAGAPNSGHTPGTPHPTHLPFIVQAGDHADDPEHPCTDHECIHVGQTEDRPNPLQKHVGSEYEEDDSVSFLAVESDDPDRVNGVLRDTGWALRMFVTPVLQSVDEEIITPEERMARAERDLAILKGLAR